MKLALDFDNTYTADPDFWNEVIDVAKRFQHEIRVVTARSPTHDNIGNEIDHLPVIYCDGVAKRFVCHHFNDWDPDVWIDDKPESVFQNSTASKEVLAEWRANRGVA